jgi:hypothetical protein
MCAQEHDRSFGQRLPGIPGQAWASTALVLCELQATHSRCRLLLSSVPPLALGMMWSQTHMGEVLPQSLHANSSLATICLILRQLCP